MSAAKRTRFSPGHHCESSVGLRCSPPLGSTHRDPAGVLRTDLRLARPPPRSSRAEVVSQRRRLSRQAGFLETRLRANPPPPRRASRQSASSSPPRTKRPPSRLASSASRLHCHRRHSGQAGLDPPPSDARADVAVATLSTKPSERHASGARGHPTAAPATNDYAPPHRASTISAPLRQLKASASAAALRAVPNPGPCAAAPPPLSSHPDAPRRRRPRGLARRAAVARRRSDRSTVSSARRPSPGAKHRRQRISPSRPAAAPSSIVRRVAALSVAVQHLLRHQRPSAGSGEDSESAKVILIRRLAGSAAAAPKPPLSPHPRGRRMKEAPLHHSSPPASVATRRRVGRERKRRLLRFRPMSSGVSAEGEWTLLFVTEERIRCLISTHSF